jgi:hypothetical protein
MHPGQPCGIAGKRGLVRRLELTHGHAPDVGDYRTRTRTLVSDMPQPGDPIIAFSVQPGRCFRMVYSVQLQADHCHQVPVWKGSWRDVQGRTWQVEACPDHAPSVSPSPPDRSQKQSLENG